MLNLTCSGITQSFESCRVLSAFTGIQFDFFDIVNSFLQMGTQMMTYFKTNTERS